MLIRTCRIRMRSTGKATTKTGLPLVLAISDGHGSEKYFRSDQGAKFAVTLAVEELTQFAQTFAGPSHEYSSL